MLICKFCNKECKNKNSLAQHEIRCPRNPQRIEIYKRYGKDHHNYGKKGVNHFTKAREMGEEIIVSEETREKISNANRRRIHKKWTDEQKSKHSHTMQKVVQANIESYTKNNVCGRVKTIHYKDYKLKGSWEEKVAKWLDKNNVEWDYESNKEYYIWNDRKKVYIPDFYIPMHDIYIEVKGFQTDRDIAKWNYVSKPIIIIDKNIINELENLSFNKALVDNRWRK